MPLSPQALTATLPFNYEGVDLIAVVKTPHPKFDPPESQEEISAVYLEGGPEKNLLPLFSDPDATIWPLIEEDYAHWCEDTHAG